MGMQYSFQPKRKRSFLGGVSKTEVLAAFGAHIFFDDQELHTEPASAFVPSATVPYREGDNPRSE